MAEMEKIGIEPAAQRAIAALAMGETDVTKLALETLSQKIRPDLLTAVKEALDLAEAMATDSPARARAVRVPESFQLPDSRHNKDARFRAVHPVIVIPVTVDGRLVRAVLQLDSNNKQFCRNKTTREGILSTQQEDLKSMHCSPASDEVCKAVLRHLVDRGQNGALLPVEKLALSSYTKGFVRGKGICLSINRQNTVVEWGQSHGGEAHPKMFALCQFRPESGAEFRAQLSRP